MAELRVTPPIPGEVYYNKLHLYSGNGGSYLIRAKSVLEAHKCYVGSEVRPDIIDCMLDNYVGKVEVVFVGSMPDLSKTVDLEWDLGYQTYRLYAKDKRWSDDNFQKWKSFVLINPDILKKIDDEWPSKILIGDDDDFDYELVKCPLGEGLYGLIFVQAFEELKEATDGST